MKCEICGKDILENSQCIDYKYYHNDCIINLTKENQKLQTEKKQLNSLVNSCQEEIRQLKKQLEDMTLCRDIASGHREEVQDREAILLNQQKEFIKYLESEIDRLEKTEFYIDSIQKAAIETHKHNLSKYKEIIGVSK